MLRKFLFVTLCFCSAWCLSQAQDEPVQKKEKEKASTYSVVQIHQSPMEMNIVIMEDKLVEAKKKEMEKAHEDAMKTWEAAKKEAEKNKERLTVPKPMKTGLKVLCSGLTEDKAKEEKEKAEKAWKERMEKAKKDGKEGMGKKKGMDKPAKKPAKKEADSKEADK